MKELINIIAFSALFGQIYMNITCYESDLEQFSCNSFVSFNALQRKSVQLARRRLTQHNAKQLRTLQQHQSSAYLAYKENYKSKWLIECQKV